MQNFGIPEQMPQVSDVAGKIQTQTDSIAALIEPVMGMIQQQLVNQSVALTAIQKKLKTALTRATNKTTNALAPISQQLLATVSAQTASQGARIATMPVPNAVTGAAGGPPPQQPLISSATPTLDNSGIAMPMAFRPPAAVNPPAAPIRPNGPAGPQTIIVANDVCAEIGDWFVVSDGYWIRSADLGEPVLIWYGPGMVDLGTKPDYANGTTAKVMAVGTVPQQWGNKPAICLDPCLDGRGPQGWPCTQTAPIQPPAGPPANPPAGPPANPPAGPTNQPLPEQQPPATPTPTVAAPICPTPIPFVGSEEFCKNIDAIKVTMIEAGNIVIAYIDAHFTPDGVFGPRRNYDDTSIILDVSNPILGSIQGWLNNRLADVVNAGRWVIEQLRAAYDWCKSIICKYVSCEPSGMLAIWILRSAVRILRKTRLGTDAGAWATCDVELSFDQVERLLDYMADFMCPVMVPGIDQAIQCYLAGTASLPLARCWVAMQGGNWDVWYHIIMARRSRPNAQQVIEWSRRQGLPDEELPKYLRNYGYIVDDETDAAIKLYDKVLTEGQTYTWLRSQLLDPQFVTDYGLLSGFEQRYWPSFKDGLRSQGITKDVSQYNYAAHWNIPGNGQLLEMVYRLRPDKYGPDTRFTLTDYMRFTTGWNTLPYFQTRLEAISRPLPSIGQVRSWYDLLIIDDVQLTSYYQDHGYSPDHALAFVAHDKLQRVRTRAASGQGWTPAALAKAYAGSIITDQQVRDEMQLLGYTADESARLMARSLSDQQYRIFIRAKSRVLSTTVTQVKQAIAIGVMDVNQASMTLQALGWTPDQANALAQLEASAANMNGVKMAVQAIRKAYLAGEVDSRFAAQSLSNLGIVGVAVQQYLALWGVMNTPNRKRRTSSQIVADAAAGYISTEEAIVRLRNLGYEDADTRLFLADANAKIANAEAKQQAAELKAGKARQAALAKAAADMERQKGRIVAALRKEASPGKLQKWAKLGLIDEGEFYDRFRLYGYEDEWIEKQWQEACQAKNAACIPTVVEQQGTGSNGASGGQAAGGPSSGGPGVP